MITLALMSVAGLLFTGLVSAVALVPLPSPAGLVAPVETAAAFLGNAAASVSFWVPVNVLGPVLAVVVVAYLAAWGIRLLRLVLSLVTGGGGSGA